MVFSVYNLRSNIRSSNIGDSNIGSLDINNLSNTELRNIELRNIELHKKYIKFAQKSLKNPDLLNYNNDFKTYNDVLKESKTNRHLKKNKKSVKPKYLCKNPKKKNIKWLKKLKNRTVHTSEECNKATFAYAHGVHPEYSTFLDCFWRKVNCYINGLLVYCKTHMILCPKEVDLKPVKNPNSSVDDAKCTLPNMIQKWPNLETLKECLPDGRIGTLDNKTFYIKENEKLEKASWLKRLFTPNSWQPLKTR